MGRVGKEVGNEVKIKINNITDKAIFGEIIGSGLSGMLHYKEISFKENIDDLKNIKNDILNVKLLEIKNEIRFSKRALEKDPLEWFKDNNKKLGDVITTKVHEVLKTGVKVSVDKEKNLILIKELILRKSLRMLDPKYFHLEMHLTQKSPS